jgi:phosphate/sulfate permease
MLRELLARERREKVSAWELALTAVGNFLGHGSERIQKTVSPLRAAYAEEVFHKSYSVSSLREKLVKRLAAMREIGERMEKLEKMTAG